MKEERDKEFESVNKVILTFPVMIMFIMRTIIIKANTVVYTVCKRKLF